MGQAKNRLSKMIAAHPYCCLCGGKTPTESIEHAPPKIMFWEKHRPQGMEVPACKRCNNGTSEIDQLAAFYALTQSDRSINGLGNTEEDYFDKVSRGCLSNIPDMKDIFKLGPNVDENYGKIIFDDQKLFVEKLNPWAAKQSLAHWFTLTHGKIFPPQGLVTVRWLTNVELLTNDPLLNLIKKLPSLQGLEMGKWAVHDQFFVHYSLNLKKNIGGMFVRYHGTGFIAALIGDESALRPEMKVLGGYGASFKTNGTLGIYDYIKTQG